MNTILTIANWALPLAYLALLIDYGACFFLHVRTRTPNLWLLPVIGAHAAFLALRAAALGRPPLDTGVEILSVVALSIAIVYTVTEYASRDRRVGVFMFLLIFLLQYSSSVFLGHPAAAPPPAAPSGWARLHIVPAILAYTAVSVAAVYGLLHLIAQRNLKRRRFGPLFDRLPSLERLGRMSWHAVLVGFLLLTVTLATAAGMMLLGPHDATAASGVLTPRITTRIIVGCAAWLIYLAAIIGRWVFHWPVARVSGVAVNGYVAIVALFVLTAVLT